MSRSIHATSITTAFTWKRPFFTAGPSSAMTTVAVMQPYFIPYAGYFRLFAAADLFVVYDCVQFPRRGWVHRNRLPDADGELRWLTLPLATAPREVTIRDLTFRAGASEALSAQFTRFPMLAQPTAGQSLIDELTNIS